MQTKYNRFRRNQVYAQENQLYAPESQKAAKYSKLRALSTIPAELM